VECATLQDAKDGAPTVWWESASKTAILVETP
jgi:hypothetical protein